MQNAHVPHRLWLLPASVLGVALAVSLALLAWPTSAAAPGEGRLIPVSAAARSAPLEVDATQSPGGQQQASSPTGTPIPACTTYLTDTMEGPNSNNSFDDASTVSVGGTYTDLTFYWKYPAPDTDYYRIWSRTGRSYRAETTLATGLDSYAEVYDSAQQLLGFNDDKAYDDYGSLVEWAGGDADAWFYVKVINKSSLDPTNKTYTLAIRDITSATSTPSATPPSVSTVVSPLTGGTLSLKTKITTSAIFPPNAVSEAAMVTLAVRDSGPISDTHLAIAPAVALEAHSLGGDSLTSTLQAYSLLVSYGDMEVALVKENSLKLYRQDTISGQWVALSNSVVDVDTNSLTASLSDLGRFVVLGEHKESIYLPLIVRNSTR